MGTAITSKLRIYPIKSLGFVEADEVEVGFHSLKNDRQFAMVDADGRYLNGKRNNQVNLLKTDYDLANASVTFSDETSGIGGTFELREENEALNEFISDYFDLGLQLVSNDQGQFMDMPAESSVTIVSEASLQHLQQDLDRHTLENMRQRFRSNIEVSGVEAYWEEQLYHTPGVGMRFRVGDVHMIGISPRARCNVPPQSPENGEIDYHFIKNMIASRKDHSPSAEKVIQYGKAHYFLTINVYVPPTEAGKVIRLHDEIEVLDQVRFG